MPKPWPITSLRGNAGLSDDSEDPRGDPQEPVRDDYPEPDYFAETVERLRAQAELLSPEVRRQALDSLATAELQHDEAMDRIVVRNVGSL